MSDPQGYVTAALAAVIADLPGIGRDGRASQQQGGYAYRGIEQITKEAAPLLAKHGVVFVPQVVSMEFRDVQVGGKPWTDTILTVRYRICGPGGPDDFLEAIVVGIGRDGADKGANKALTQAFKYALLQVLCIADDKDDGDSHTHEADTRRVDAETGEVTGAVPPPTVLEKMTPRELLAACRTAGVQLGGTPEEMRERLKIAGAEGRGSGGTIPTGESVHDDEVVTGTSAPSSPSAPDEPSA